METHIYIFILPCKNIILKKKKHPLKETKNPSRYYYNSIK
jgi:hypothetical protein